MRLKTKLVKIGNGLAIRLPKNITELVEFKLGQPLDIEVRPDRLIIRLPKNLEFHRYDRAYQDFKKDWQRIGEDAWIEMFGPDYDGPGPHLGQ
jgi:antitoxin component of MazEF toxin-antitoxin module